MEKERAEEGAMRTEKSGHTCPESEVRHQGKGIKNKKEGEKMDGCHGRG